MSEVSEIYSQQPLLHRESLSLRVVLSRHTIRKAYPYLAEESGSCAVAERGVGADVIRSVNITFQDEVD